jgi:hypothetical protein
MSVAKKKRELTIGRYSPRQRLGLDMSQGGSKPKTKAQSQSKPETSGDGLRSSVPARCNPPPPPGPSCFANEHAPNLLCRWVTLAGARRF